MNKAISLTLLSLFYLFSLSIAQNQNREKKSGSRGFSLFDSEDSWIHGEHDFNCNLNMSPDGSLIKLQQLNENNHFVFDVNSSDTVTDQRPFFFSLHHNNLDYLSDSIRETGFPPQLYCGPVYSNANSVNLQQFLPHIIGGGFNDYIYIEAKSSTPIKLKLAFQDGFLPDDEGDNTDTIGFIIDLTEETQYLRDAFWDDFDWSSGNSELPTIDSTFINSSGNSIDLTDISFLQFSILPDENGVYPNLKNETITIEYIDVFSYVIGSIGQDHSSLQTTLSYPNPTSGAIKFEEDLTINTIEVYDRSGILVKSMKDNFDIHDLKNGFYILHIHTGTGLKYCKVMKR